MKFWRFVRDRVGAILVFVVGMVLAGMVLVAFKVPGEAILVVMGIFMVGGTVSLGVEYGRKRRFYTELVEKAEQLDQAYLVLETMREPEFYEGELVWRAMREIDKSMAENVQRERERSRDFQEYIEMWIHEVKRPLASLGLVVENLWKTPEKTGVGRKNGKMGKLAENDGELVEKGEKEMKNVGKLVKNGQKEEKNDGKRGKNGMGLGGGKAKIQRNLKELEKYVKQVLYFVRGENAEKDYLIREVDLSEIVKKVVIKNMDDFLDNGVEFEVEMGEKGRGEKNVAMKVYSDAKWLEFVVNQMVDNSIKYRRGKGAKVVIRGWKEGGVIDGGENRTKNEGNRTKSEKNRMENRENSTENEKNRTILEIEDNGIGIAAGDLPMVFEKTFTGENGRKGAVAKINEKAERGMGMTSGTEKKAERGMGMTSTGMGLYIAKNLCEKLGHRIEIESEEGKGTKVRIVFEDNGFYGVVK